ncbi:MAG: hypothetical protein PF495_18090, partial [Spirochaetales bacterium]|nr:hypothetical protein [Spirochaetales bacterium]
MNSLIKALAYDLYTKTGIIAAPGWEEAVRRDNTEVILTPRMPYLHSSPTGASQGYYEMGEDTSTFWYWPFVIEYTINGSNEADYVKAINDLMRINEYCINAKNIPMGGDIWENITYSADDENDEDTRWNFGDYSRELLNLNLTVGVTFDPNQENQDIFSRDQIGTNGWDINV